MQRKIGILAALLLLCGLVPAAPPVTAQSMAGVSGVVTDLEGKPLADVTVIFKSPDTGLSYTSKTDKNGHYSQVGMRPGLYDVTLKQKDQIIFTTKQPITPAPDNVFDIPFKEYARKESPEEAAARKKQEEEHQKFQGMKAHFDAGRAKADAAQQLRTEIAKAPADQRAPMQEKLKGLYQDALTEFQQSQQAASDKDPNLHVVWYNLGDTYDRMGKYQEAAEAYQKAIDLKPDVAGYYNNLGNVLAKLGKIPEATKAYEKSVALDPSNAAGVWLNSGIVLYNANRLADAVEPLQKATALNPKNPQAWYLLGASLVATMDVKQEGDKMIPVLKPGTVEAYQKCLELDPNGPWGAQAKQGLEQLQSIGAGVDTKVRVKKKP
jgi:tetratricopeptide (TPR) repeat protein